MKPPTRSKFSTFPLDKPFESLGPVHQFRGIIFPLVVNFETDAATVVGTASPIAPNLLLTAKHVVEEAAASMKSGTSISEIIGRFSAVQVKSEDKYQIWDVARCWTHPLSDLAVLQTESNPWFSGSEPDLTWDKLRLRAFPPQIGERVAAFGHRKSTIHVRIQENKNPYVELNSELMSSVGQVREVFELRRDSTILTFPCYQVSARFDGGMSGGPVFDEAGAVCGVVCTGVENSHNTGEPISYVCSLWPIFRMRISANRGDNYPRGISYPIQELATDGQISVIDFDKLQTRFSLRR